MSDMNFDEYQNIVIDLAASQIQDKPWFQGCCCDTIKQSYRDQLSVTEAADRVIDDTFYWDGGKI